MNSCITLTFCECSENHVGMEKNGTLALQGYSSEDLDKVINYLQNETNFDDNIERYNLVDYLGKTYTGEKPELLLIRNLVSEHQSLYQDLINITWDRKYFDTRRQKVLNKRARANLCFAEESQEANYENKKGTKIAYDSIPNLL